MKLGASHAGQTIVCAKANNVSKSRGSRMAQRFKCHSPLTRTLKAQIAVITNIEHSKTASHHGSTVPYGMQVNTITANKRTKTPAFKNRPNFAIKVFGRASAFSGSDLRGIDT